VTADDVVAAATAVAVVVDAAVILPPLALTESACTNCNSNTATEQEVQ
jgi:hypothetical protein